MPIYGLAMPPVERWRHIRKCLEVVSDVTHQAGIEDLKGGLPIQSSFLMLATQPRPLGHSERFLISGLMPVHHLTSRTRFTTPITSTSCSGGKGQIPWPLWFHFLITRRAATHTFALTDP